MDYRRIDRARKLRKDAPFPERLLWGKLRRSAAGARFRRQQPIGTYVVDFYCAEARLIVELDGISHMRTGVKDLARQAWLEAEGYRVVRFTNDEVLEDLDGVVRQIASVLQRHGST